VLGHEAATVYSHEGHGHMIFLIITFLAWAILSIGLVGVEWGYGAWAQARLDTSAQFLVLDSFSESKNQHRDAMILGMVMGTPTLPKANQTNLGPGVTQIQLSQRMRWPGPSLLRGSFVQQPSSPFEVTSIATAQLLPARQVGLPQAGHLLLPGAVPCSLVKEAWETIPEQEPVAVMINSLGEIFLQGKRIGQFGQTLTHIGQAVPDLHTFQAPQVSLDGYVSIFTQIGTSHRVVGFGYAQIYGTYPHMLIRKQVIETRSPNASTQLMGKRLSLSPQDLAQVFSVNRTLKEVILAPTFM